VWVIFRDSSGLFETAIFRKKTHTERYLNFNSHHCPQHLRSVPNTLVRRAFLLCSTKDLLRKELDHIGAVLKANDYPESFMLKAVSGLPPPLHGIPHFDSRLLPKMWSTPKPKAEPSPHKGLIFLPYIHVLSNKLKKFLTSQGYKVIFRSCHSLRNILVHPKDKLEKPDGEGVYLVPCDGNKKKTCDAHYIGETRRNLSARLSEEKADVAQNRDKSLIADHAWTQDHNIAWNRAHVILKEANKSKRWFKETLCIKSSPNCYARATHPISQHWITGLRDSLPDLQ